MSSIFLSTCSNIFFCFNPEKKRFGNLPKRLQIHRKMSSTRFEYSPEIKTAAANIDHLLQSRFRQLRSFVGPDPSWRRCGRERHFVAVLYDHQRAVAEAERDRIVQRILDGEAAAIAVEMIALATIRRPHRPA